MPAIPEPASPAPSMATPKERQSVRMKRMQMILQKALDVSVHAASLVDLRACLESECRADEELLAAFFPADGPERHSTEEVAAQAVLSLRQKVETLFQWLCETHDVNAELLELEDAIEQAEERRMRQVTAEQKQAEQEEKQENVEEKPEDKTSPQARIRAERLRAKQDEQKELEALVQALESKNNELQRSVEEKRRQATADVQRITRAAIQLEQVSQLAKDFATAP